MGADCKSAGYAYAGSNPARPMCPCSSVVEHTLGKGEVTSSILVKGFRKKGSNSQRFLLNQYTSCYGLKSSGLDFRRTRSVNPGEWLSDVAIGG